LSFIRLNTICQTQEEKIKEIEEIKEKLNKTKRKNQEKDIEISELRSQVNFLY